MLRKLCLAVALTAFTAALPGCIFVAKKHDGRHGAHPSSHRHEHCHDKGKHHKKGKHGKKQVCHSHPHGGGHH